MTVLPDSINGPRTKIFPGGSANKLKWPSIENLPFGIFGEVAQTQDNIKRSDEGDRTSCRADDKAGMISTGQKDKTYFFPAVEADLALQKLYATLFTHPCEFSVKMDGTNVGMDCYGNLYGRNLMIAPDARVYQATGLEAVRRVDVRAVRNKFVEELEQIYTNASPSIVFDTLVDDFVLQGELLCNRNTYDYSYTGVVGKWLVFGAQIKVASVGGAAGAGAGVAEFQKLLHDAGFAVGTVGCCAHDVIRISVNRKFRRMFDREVLNRVGAAGRAPEHHHALPEFVPLVEIEAANPLWESATDSEIVPTTTTTTPTPLALADLLLSDGIFNLVANAEQEGVIFMIRDDEKTETRPTKWKNGFENSSPFQVQPLEKLKELIETCGHDCEQKVVFTFGLDAPITPGDAEIDTSTDADRPSRVAGGRATFFSPLLNRIFSPVEQKKLLRILARCLAVFKNTTRIDLDKDGKPPEVTKAKRKPGSEEQGKPNPVHMKQIGRLFHTLFSTDEVRMSVQTRLKQHKLHQNKPYADAIASARTKLDVVDSFIMAAPNPIDAPIHNMNDAVFPDDVPPQKAGFDNYVSLIADECVADVCVSFGICPTDLKPDVHRALVGWFLEREWEKVVTKIASDTVGGAEKS